ncbi:MAG: PIN domain-containing protein [Nocardioidaceae bacterium]|nr:MAG: PIN domain-containing protein [Nocardioidaceae bacterium]
MFASVLDTSVLWPSLQRDFLLSMAIEGLYRPLWSSAILGELRRHERLKLLARGVDEGAAHEAANYLIEQMTGAFDDALVEGWEPLDGVYRLPDPDDEHVVAAAVVGGAGVIVTENLSDFPPAKIPGIIQVLPARDFAANTADVDPERAALALHAISSRRVRASQTPHELLDLLAIRYGMTDVRDILKPVLDEMQPPA